jgi:hypothetical protein
MGQASLAVPGNAYDRFVGRYSRQLAPRFLELAGVDRGPVLEAGCGPGALTTVLAARFGAVLSQLVLSFVGDAPRAMAEMLRVVRPGGIVAACTFAEDGFALVGTFWRAALRLDPAAPTTRTSRSAPGSPCSRCGGSPGSATWSSGGSISRPATRTSTTTGIRSR